MIEVLFFTVIWLLSCYVAYQWGCSTAYKKHQQKAKKRTS